MSDENVKVVHETSKSRFEVYVDDTLAGFAEYRSREAGSQFAFMHTEVFDEFGGRGLAGTLVRSALDELREAGVRAVPYCPYVVKWIKKHPEYADMTDWPADAKS